MSAPVVQEATDEVVKVPRLSPRLRGELIAHRQTLLEHLGAVDVLLERDTNDARASLDKLAAAGTLVGGLIKPTSEEPAS